MKRRNTAGVRGWWRLAASPRTSLSLFVLTAAVAACGKDDDSGSSAQGGTPANSGGSFTASGGRNSGGTGGNAAGTGGRNGAGGNAANAGVSHAAGEAGASEAGGAHSGSGGQSPTTGGRSASGGAEAGANDGGVEAGGTTTGGREATGGQAQTGGAPASGAHIPAITPEQTGEVFAGSAIEGLEVTRSHYYEKGSGQGLDDFVWLGLVRNESSELRCRIGISLTLSGPGDSAVKLVGSVIGPMYRFAGMRQHSLCLGPGEEGVAIAAPFEQPPPFEPEEVEAVAYGISGESGGDMIAADWFSLNDVEVAAESGGSVVRGALEKNSAATVTGVRIYVFPQNAQGAPLTYFTLSDPSADALSQGAAWQFETPISAGSFDDALVFYEHGTPSAP